MIAAASSSASADPEASLEATGYKWVMVAGAVDGPSGGERGRPASLPHHHNSSRTPFHAANLLPHCFAAPTLGVYDSAQLGEFKAI